MRDTRGCSLQRPVDRLVTTPQTVQSFMDQLALRRRCGSWRSWRWWRSIAAYSTSRRAWAGSTLRSIRL